MPTNAQISGVGYRKCDMFRWRDDLGRLPPEMVDEMWSKKNLGPANREKSGVKCSGQSCSVREQPRPGNRSCSNGRYCRNCCERAQKNGASACNYSSHNAPTFSFSNGVVSVSSLSSLFIHTWLHGFIRRQ